MRLAVIGNQIKDFKQDQLLLREVQKKVFWCIEQIKPDEVDIYLTPGVGFFAARACQQLEIPYRAILAFRHQSQVWPKGAQRIFHRFLKKASSVIYVDRQPGYILRSHPPDIYRKEKLFALSRWVAAELKTEVGDQLLVTTFNDEHVPLHGGHEAHFHSRINFLGVSAISHLGLLTSLLYSYQRWVTKIVIESNPSQVTAINAILVDEEEPF